MYDLSLHVRWLRLVAALCFTLPRCSEGLKNERAGLLVRSQSSSVTLDSRGKVYVAEDGSGMDKVQPSQTNTQTTLVRSLAQYYLHSADGMSFSEKIPTGTQFGDVTCDGVTYCQFYAFEEARDFCNSNTACHGVLQQTHDVAAECDGGLGCFFPAKGHLFVDAEWTANGGKTYERQVLAYNRFADGRKLNAKFPVGTRGCGGVTYCQFATEKPALDWCDLDSECLGVLKMPETGQNCTGGKGCYAPGKGTILHDPLWLNNVGETYLKQQTVAYRLHNIDGKVFDARYRAGTAGCQGVHNCQFKTLPDAQAWCDADPTCKGVIKTPPHLDAYQAPQDCADGLGCFQPCKGELKYDALFLITEGKVYERRLVR